LKIPFKFSSDFRVWGTLIICGAVCGCVLLSLPIWIDKLHFDTIGPAGVCINNLRQIDAAANQFAQEHHLTNGAPINFLYDLTPYIKLNRSGSLRPCPQGGIYSINKVGDKPTCSLSTLTPPHALQ
jgi:hypothetical protein